MSEFLFVFGRSPDLSWREFLSFFPNSQRLISDVAIVKDEIDPMQLILQLGGTVKIVQVVKRVGRLIEEEMVEILARDSKRITFGISTYGGLRVERNFLGRIKEGLAQRGIAGRFIEAKDGKELSSVVIAKEELTELVIVETTEGMVIGVTKAVQPFDEWSKRDYGRPWADARSGMLPPKVARMAVNIAGSQFTVHSSRILVDPFCGMGTILGEAMLAGWNVIGSDQAGDVVRKAEGNMTWLRSVYPVINGFSSRLFVSDATHISEELDAGIVDAIVTEPFMGKSLEGKGQRAKNKSAEDIRNVIRGLEKLYIGCLRDWQKVLKPGGRVVMALPKWVWNKQEFFVKKVIDSCEKLGYTVTVGPIEYSRPQAVVKREFYIFEKI